MSGSYYTPQGQGFPDVSFTTAANDHGPVQNIDFNSSQAFFGQLEDAHSPAHTGAYNYGSHPPAAISGADPVSKLGFASGRSLPREPNANPDFGFASGSSGYANHHSTRHAYGSLPSASYAPSHYVESWQDSQADQPILGQHSDDAARRTAEVERRNRVREEEKARRTLAIEKQINDGMAALKLEKDEAAHRSAEVERRNKAREEEKAQRKLAIQKQVEDGIKAIKLEKERQRAKVEADRQACRKWLSDVPEAAGFTARASTSSASSIDFYGAVGRQIRGFWESSRPSASHQTQRAEVIADVQRAINNRWPGQDLKVAAFGSSVTGLITSSSDLDLVLLDPTRPFGVGTPSEFCVQPNRPVRHSGGMPEWYSTSQIANALRASNRFRNVVPISGASVPIVKMVHRKHGIPADININERFGLFNSQLICAYADLQPDLVRPLIFFLKHWYGQRELNDPAGKRGSMTFSSYTIALMALQVFQVEGVLPNLQSPELLRSLDIRPSFLYSRAKRPRARRGKNRFNGGALNGDSAGATEDTTPPQKYDVTFAPNHADFDSCKSKGVKIAKGESPGLEETSTAADRLLGKMLVNFVRFYSQLDRRTHAVSVVKGGLLRRRRESQPRHVFFDSASEDGRAEGDANGAGAVTNYLQFAPADADGAQEVYDEETDVWSGDEIVVQDPFIIDRNTARNIKSNAVERWQGEMQRALRLLGAEQSGDARSVAVEKVPLILDLCIPQNVLSDMEANGDGVMGAKTESAKSEEPRRLEEEAAAQEREIAKQAAKELQKEKKRAKRSKRREAKVLQEEAAMVEDMIDGIETGHISGMMKGNEQHERWRLRMDSNDDTQTTKEPAPIPFTFSVARSPTKPVISLPRRNQAPPRANISDAKLSPTTPVATTTTDA